jgi:hypothetical protein
VKCEFCAEEIPDDATKCPRCGESLVESDHQLPGGGIKLTTLLLAVGAICLVPAALVAVLTLAVRPPKVNRPRTKSYIFAIKAALASYEADVGHFPRLAPRAPGPALLDDDALALSRALLAPPGQGGGPNGPYVQDWPAKYLSQGPEPMLLDLWGNPFHYREWDSVRSADKAGLSAPRSVGRRTIQDVPRTPDLFDVWSDGPNGVNEFGDPASDDVVSWR